MFQSARFKNDLETLLTSNSFERSFDFEKFGSGELKGCFEALANHFMGSRKKPVPGAKSPAGKPEQMKKSVRGSSIQGSTSHRINGSVTSKGGPPNSSHTRKGDQSPTMEKSVTSKPVTNRTSHRT